MEYSGAQNKRDNCCFSYKMPIAVRVENYLPKQYAFLIINEKTPIKKLESNFLYFFHGNTFSVKLEAVKFKRW